MGIKSILSFVVTASFGAVCPPAGEEHRIRFRAYARSKDRTEIDYDSGKHNGDDVNRQLQNDPETIGVARAIIKYKRTCQGSEDD